MEDSNTHINTYTTVISDVNLSFPGSVSLSEGDGSVTARVTQSLRREIAVPVCVTDTSHSFPPFSAILCHLCLLFCSLGTPNRPTFLSTSIFTYPIFPLCNSHPTQSTFEFMVFLSKLPAHIDNIINFSNSRIFEKHRSP